MSQQSVDKALDLVRNKPKAIQEQIEQIYDGLPGVSPDFMLGEWKSGFLNMDHAVSDFLTSVGYVGKSFWSAEDVDFLIKLENGKRVWIEEFGKARLREVKFRGVLSATLIHDTLPIIDYFRKVTDDLVLGMMDSKLPEHGVNYVFFLERIKPQ